MASKRRNMFQKNKTQETTENGGAVQNLAWGQSSAGSRRGDAHWGKGLTVLPHMLTVSRRARDKYMGFFENNCNPTPGCEIVQFRPPQQGATLTPLVPWEMETELGKTSWSRINIQSSGKRVPRNITPPNYDVRLDVWPPSNSDGASAACGVALTWTHGCVCGWFLMARWWWCVGRRPR
ncbi:hypothetical protein AAG570_006954 [Ranatra chinensis]|uniref:Uncharacterized protein n=1 Tax=Ranatra chinensis TaxID=642074 RepID=A0ABD0Z628_9HEMI